MNIIPTKVSSFEDIINTLIKSVKTKGLDDIKAFLESLDQHLYENKQSHLYVVKFKERVIQTTIGMLRFKRRYYYDTFEEKYLYLLDAFLDIPKRNRFMNDVKLKIIQAASEMSYEKAGRYACEDNLPASKSTVYRFYKQTSFYIEENNSLIPNDNLVHIQIDEKFVNVKESKNQKKLYTATIFKGLRVSGKKHILENRTLISSNKLDIFFKKINKRLKDKYKVSFDDKVYLSGDLARYIQNAPEKITVCKCIYVPDKYHIKQALKDELGVICSDKDLNDVNFVKTLINALKDSTNVNAKKVYNFLKRNSNALSAYLDDNYLGCSQEGMNSHYYASRLDKVPNIWHFDTITKITKIIEAQQNDSIVKLGFKEEYYDMPYDLNVVLDINTIAESVMFTDGMPYDMKKFFDRLAYGKDATIV